MNPPARSTATPQARYHRTLLLVAGLGGLLFGIDVGIIAGALPYLEATSRFSADQLSFIVAAVLLGGVFSTLFAGLLADAFGRRPLMTLSGLLFAASVPMIALSRSYEALVCGRLLQGISGGFIGVVVPLYLAECLPARSRGRGTAVFQWLLTMGIVAAALIGYYFSRRVEAVAQLGDAARLFAIKDSAWRGIFWASLPPGLLFVVGSLRVSESPRWLFRRGRPHAALAALLRSRPADQAEAEMREMTAAAAPPPGPGAPGARSSLWQRKYILPFALACVILACNQATGVNSIIGYNATILLQAGLNDEQAHLGYLILTVVNVLGTMLALALVDRQGRKFLLCLGTAGVILSLAGVGWRFHRVEARRVEVRDQVQALISAAGPDDGFAFDAAVAARLLGRTSAAGGPAESLEVIYARGGFAAATPVVRSDEPGARVTLDRDGCLPATAVAAFFQNPFASLAAARAAPLVIQHAVLTPVPDTANGWWTALLLDAFMASFAAGPGVCVWLALSELMPTRIRSNGMSAALLLNIAVSTGIAAVFLPTVGRHGYAMLFEMFAGCTLVYFLTAAFLLPETKGRTLEEIEAHFAGTP